MYKNITKNRHINPVVINLIYENFGTGIYVRPSSNFWYYPMALDFIFYVINYFFML